MSRGFEAYLESGTKTLKQLENYRDVAKKIRSIVSSFWKDSKVYVFGSVTKGKQTAMSDIDILIVVDNVSREQSLMVKAEIYMAVDAPIELHVASNEEFTGWYRRFIDKLEEIPS